MISGQLISMQNCFVATSIWHMLASKNFNQTGMKSNVAEAAIKYQF